MHHRAAQLVDALGLTPHPEGGRYAEVYRSASRVQPDDGRGERPGMTTIYFLLVSGEWSAWHRVASDEAWHFYEGDPLELFVADAAFAGVSRRLLGPAAEGQRPIEVVKAGEWQAARPAGAFTLVGCTVGPGFDFADFEMLDAASTAADALRRSRPDLAALAMSGRFQR